MSKHLKTEKPTDADLKGNPMIGGSKGVVRAGLTPDDLDDLQGETTIAGDEGNDVNAVGGIDKDEARSSTPTDRR